MIRRNGFLCASRLTRMVVIAVEITVALIVLGPRAEAQIFLPESLEWNLAKRMSRYATNGEGGNSSAGSFVNLQPTLVSEVRRARITADQDRDSEAHLNDFDDTGNRKATDVPRQPLPDHSIDQEIWPHEPVDRFQWGEAFKQSMLFLGIQHSFRLATEQGSRADLKGPFWKDYWKSLTSLKGWEDGDPFIVNYIGHPMMGSVTGYIQIQNDPKGIDEQLSLKKSYWMSRLKALGWSAAYSTQFELGLISEATLGNIGIRPYGKAKNPMAYVDLVVTPVLGTGWLVGEDALDQYFIRRLERRLPNRTTLILIRSFLNPTRSFANLMRGKWPWHRDDRH